MTDLKYYLISIFGFLAVISGLVMMMVSRAKDEDLVGLIAIAVIVLGSILVLSGCVPLFIRSVGYQFQSPWRRAPQTERNSEVELHDSAVVYG